MSYCIDGGKIISREVELHNVYLDFVVFCSHYKEITDSVNDSVRKPRIADTSIMKRIEPKHTKLFLTVRKKDRKIERERA